ncbi:LysR family transcriptional regulator [bacterium]|nr:LysR family transcriptional regulator [bacterium]
MIDLLRAFIAIADSGSMTEAARRLFKTQSAISQQIGRLEQLLGANLLIREQPIRLTDDGERLLGYARQMIDLEATIVSTFNEPEMIGDIRLGIPEDYSQVLLEPVLDGFAHRYPQIRLQIECDLTDTLLNRMGQGHLDIAVVKTRTGSHLPSGHLVEVSPLVWFGSDRVLATNREVPIVVSPHPCIYRDIAIQSLRQAGVAWRVVFSSYQTHNLIHAVRSGLGVGILPIQLVPSDLPILRDVRLPPLSDIQLTIAIPATPTSPQRAIVGLIREALRLKTPHG